MAIPSERRLQAQRIRPGSSRRGRQPPEVSGALRRDLPALQHGAPGRNELRLAHLPKSQGWKWLQKELESGGNEP